MVGNGCNGNGCNGNGCNGNGCNGNGMCYILQTNIIIKFSSFSRKIFEIIRRKLFSRNFFRKKLFDTFFREKLNSFFFAKIFPINLTKNIVNENFREPRFSKSPTKNIRHRSDLLPSRSWS